jgi:hypothetical protein
VSDGTLTTTSGAIAISVGNPPEQAITSPVNGALFRAGDMITFSGLATDPEDGVLPSSAYTWTVLFHHDSHVHPTLGPVSGITSGTFTVPTSGHDFSGTTFYEFILTTTDSTGLQTTSSANVYPRKVNLTLTASHPGLTVTVDGITRSAPYVKDTLTGFQHAIGAPNQALGPVNYGFVSWSDGGAQAHSIVAGENDATYLATFQASTVTASPTSATVLTGTMSSGTVAALLSDDNVYYAVASTTSGTRTAAWYGAFTGVTNDLSNLRINYKGRNSANCTQTIAVWNWQTSAWVQLDSRTVGSTEVAINNVTPSGTLADYVSGASGSGELRVRVQCTANANRTSQGDLMSIVYDQPIGPDTTAPVLSNGVPSGTLPSGTTQATISLASNESATCRFGPTPGTDYASLPFAFSATGGLSHSSSLTGLTDGTSYAVFARCQDLAGNANQSDFGISFSVALPDLTPPSVSITSPAPGATVAGVVTVVATASDNVGVAGVQFLLDGVPLGAEDGTAPYSVDWTTSSVPNGGPYELTARARDATGYQTVSTAVNVTVNNSVFPGLVAAYGFEDGTGNVLTDNSGRGHPGSITGATWTTAGRFGQALTFDGINDWVTIADAADLDLTSGMTLEAWVYPTALGNGSWRNVLIKERPKGEIYSLYASADTNAPTAYVVRAAQSSVALDVRGSSQLPLNAWSHLTVTFDNATLRIYVDGVQVGARAVAGPLLTSSGVLRIGGNKIWGEYFAGRIDNVRIYNRALSESQIQTDMSTPVQP